MIPMIGLVLGGMVGAALRHLNDNDKKFIGPSRRSGEGFAPGVLGDLLAGLIVGIATAAVAPLVFKSEIVAAMLLPTVPGTAVPVPIGALGIGALLGFGWRKVLPRMSDGVASMISAEVDKKAETIAEKVDNKVDEGTKLANEPVNAALDVFRKLIEELQKPRSGAPSAAGSTARAAGGAPRGGPTSVEAPATSLRGLAEPTLQSLVDRYENIPPGGAYVPRLALKEELASQMAALAFTQNTTRPTLVAEFQRGHQEAYVLALASLVIADPQPGDVTFLLSVAKNLRRPHVRYRAVSAFAALADRRLLDEPRLAEVRAQIESFREGADASLIRKIDGTLRRLSEPAAL